MIIIVRGADELAALLEAPISRALTPIAVGVAQAVEGKLTPYPQTPPQGARRWYERGYGPRWRLKGGGLGGRRTSQMMRRRWRTRVGHARAELANFATYSGWVQSAAQQTRMHARTGWTTDRAAIDAVRREGLIERIARAKIRAVWGSVA